MRRASVAACAVALVGVMLLTTSSAGAVNFGNEGCSPGFWKNHPEVWEEYSTTTKLGAVWAIPDALASFRGATFKQALAYGGGPGLDGAAKILFRASVAAYLNAAHEGLGYPLRRFVDTTNGPSLKSQIEGALASGDRSTMLDLASYLDGLNNLGAEFCS